VLAILALVAPSILFWSRIIRLEQHHEALKAWNQAQVVYYQEVAAGQIQRRNEAAASKEMLKSLDRIERIVAERCPDGS
jgi:hypothetical protein